MRFSRDRRGQSVVVGTVILFGFLIVALGVYQVQVVPTENADVEFEHSQAVEDDFGDLRNDVLRAGSTGSTGSTQVRLGTRYPSRTFFVNPPPVSGSLSTEETGAIRIRNATVGPGARENARLFWNATDPAFETRSLRYDARYNEFRGAPELVYEHSVIAAEFDDAVLLRTGQTAVSDGQISLTALNGSVSESGIERRSVDARAVSSSDTTVPIDPEGGPITMYLPTAVENVTKLSSRWDERLPAGATADAENGTVRVTVSNASSYRLGLSEVSLDNTGDTEPSYIVPISPKNVDVGDTVVVEVRDRYNNPVPDATVTFEGTMITTNETDDDGRVQYPVGASGSFNASINGTVDPSKPEFESVQFDVSDDAGGGAENRTFDVKWIQSSPVNITENGNTDLDVQILDRQSDDLITNATIDYSFSPLQNSGSLSLTPLSSSQHDGSDTLVISPDNADVGDEFYVYAAAGDDVDRLLVQVVASGQETMADRTEVRNSQTSGGGGSRVNFDVSNTGGSDIDIDGVSIDSTSSSAEFVSAPGNNNDELTFDNGGSVDSTLQIDGSETTLDTTETIADSQTSTGSFNRFRNGGGNQVNMAGESVTITLYFTDGSQRTYVLNIP